jgi:hypothetical protein
MTCDRMQLFLAGALLALGLSPALAVIHSAEPPSYTRDIRPILSDNCFACHGPDASHRKAKLRLDVREEAMAKRAIVPGNPTESTLVQRILTTDPDDQMPPPESHKTLSPSQKDLLQRWIAAGAEYQAHWAYVAPRRPSVPSGENGIDALVKQRLEKQGLRWGPEADRRTLARRLHADLIGLPPTPGAMEAFMQDDSPAAYAKLVDRLLESPHYGERMALGWLDVVRYADTIGYHSDNPRNVWPYRDYVIRAFNQNKAFDVFTREQLAGDLLPGAGQEQKVASAFNRLLLSTEEGGAQPKDYEARMLTDRVRAVGAVWLGQTLGCAQCHDHKFDPTTSRDFYALGAFFADIEEPIIGRREDGMLVPDPQQAAELARWASAVHQLQSAYDGPHPELAAAQAAWEKAQRTAWSRAARWIPVRLEKAESSGGAKLAIADDASVLASGARPDKDTYLLQVGSLAQAVRALRIEALPHASLPAHGPGRADSGNFVLTELAAWMARMDGTTQAVRFAEARAGFEQKPVAGKEPQPAWTAASAIDGDAKGGGFGWAILPEAGKHHHWVVTLPEPLQLVDGEVLVLQLRQNHGAGHHTLGRFRLSITADPEAEVAALPQPVPDPIQALLQSAEANDAASHEALAAYYHTIAPELAPLRQQLAEAKQAKNNYEATLPRCLVSTSSPSPRVVRFLPRGNWMDETGEVMEPALPAYLPGLKPGNEGRRLTRLDLADWLVSRDNPLTARVVMNRLWKQFFGIGLAKVLDDFGMQGEPPINPDLLDWLACEFVDSGWDVRQMVRLIALSRTYRQASTAPAELMARDPDNRETARQGRWRLEAELVRDHALSIAGLLVPKIGGPSAKPYQPEGYWENLNFPPRTYQADTGESQYRRGLYTWWQRSFLHPSLVAFDAPSREECAAERSRSNIPQQALVLLNDPTYVEAARAFAERVMREGGASTEARLVWAWRQALLRPPQADESQIARGLFEKHLAEFRDDPASAQAFLQVGLSPAPADIPTAELAAWTSVTRVLLNLHECITRS